MTTRGKTALALVPVALTLAACGSSSATVPHVVGDKPDKPTKPTAEQVASTKVERVARSDTDYALSGTHASPERVRLDGSGGPESLEVASSV